MYKVNIYGVDYEFDFRKIENWKTQSGDPFAFPINIGNQNCFVKKFKKHPPKSRALLNLLNGEEVRGISPVYAFKEGKEYDLPVYYLVQKLSKGVVMDVEFKRAESRKVDVEGFATHIYWGLQEIHQHNYWHCDLCFKNVLVNVDSNDFTLIDLDSCLSENEGPDKNRIVNQDFYVALLSYFNNMGYHIELKELSGKKYNLLQLAMAVAHVSYLNIENINCSVVSINGTAKNLYQLSDERVFEIFVKGLNNALDLSDLKNLYAYLPHSIDLLEENEIKSSNQLEIEIEKALSSGVLSNKKTKKNNTKTQEDLKPSETPKKESNSGKQKETVVKKIPEIKKPEVKVKINGEDSDAFISSGKKIKSINNISIKWQIKNSTNQWLNQEFIKANSGKSIIATPNHILLKFKALNARDNKKKEIIKKIRIPVEIKPQIQLFEINQKNNSRFTFQQDEKVMISWKSINANAIYLNDNKISSHPSGTIHYTISKTEELQLNAKFEYEDKSIVAKSESIRIFVRKKNADDTTRKPSPPEEESFHPEEEPLVNNEMLETKYLTIGGQTVTKNATYEFKKGRDIFIDYEFENCESFDVNDANQNNKAGKLLIKDYIERVDLSIYHKDKNFEKALLSYSISIKWKLSLWQRIIEFIKKLFK